jgi:ATP synthase I chain.
MKWTRIILVQLIITCGTTLLSFLAGGVPAAITTALAAGSCLVPNILMLAGLDLNDKVFRKSQFTAVLVLQFVKYVTTIALIVSIFWFYKDVRWFYFLASFVITLKSYIFLLSRIET